MDTQYERLIEAHIRELMTELPAIAVDGVKGVGKTVTTKSLANTVYELDRDIDYTKLANSLNYLVDAKPPVLIDEWQKLPSSWDYIRRAVDDGAPPGSFLLTGSIASSDTSIHSGAGRIIRKRMYPLSLAERNLAVPTVSLKKMLASDKPFSAMIEGETNIDFPRYMYEIASSGLPAIRQLSMNVRKEMLSSYFDNMLSHEFSQQGIRLRQPQTLIRWLKAYAAAIATDAGYNEILDASTAGEREKPSAKLTLAYREALQNLWLLDEVYPWIDGEDYISGLKRSPKHFLADPAFAANLLGLDENLLTKPSEWPEGPSRFDRKYGNIIGRLFESLIQLCLRNYTSVNNASLSFLGTRRGDREIDFIIEKDRRIIAIEVKLAPSIDDEDVRHLLWFKGRTSTRIADAMIIYAGALAYRRKDGIAVVPAALLRA